MSLIPSLLQSYYFIRLKLSVFRNVNLALCCFKQNTLHTTLQFAPFGFITLFFTGRDICERSLVAELRLHVCSAAELKPV